MDLFEARILKLKVVAALQAANQFTDLKPYIKFTGASELREIAEKFAITRTFVSADGYPVYALDDGRDWEATESLTIFSDTEDALSELSERNKEWNGVAMIDASEIAIPNLPQIRSSLEELTRRVSRFREGLRHITWSVGLSKRINNEYVVSVKSYTANSLGGRSAPLARLARTLLDAFEVSDRGAITLDNPITPLFSNDMRNWCKGRHDTARPGIRIGVPGHGASTFCAKFVRNSSDERPEVFVGSGHGVFPFGDQSNTVQINQPDDGRPIGVAHRDRSRFPERFGQNLAADFSVIEIESGFSCENRFDDGVRRKSIVGTLEPSENMEVVCIGSSSGATEHHITSIEEDIQINLPAGQQVVMVDQALALVPRGSHTQAGDSGGPVLRQRDGDRSLYDLVGMIVAGRPPGNSPNRLIPVVITPISSIMDVGNLSLAAVGPT